MRRRRCIAHSALVRRKEGPGRSERDGADSRAGPLFEPMTNPSYALVPFGHACQNGQRAARRMPAEDSPRSPGGLHPSQAATRSNRNRFPGRKQTFTQPPGVRGAPDPSKVTRADKPKREPVMASGSPLRA
jgi:hypothetical protein